MCQRLADPTRLGSAHDSAHGIVGAALLVALDGALHGQPTIEHNIDKGRIGKGVGNGSRSREFAEGWLGRWLVNEA